MKKLIIYVMLLISLPVMAEGEMDGWYKAENGSFMVRDMVYGIVYAEIAHSKSGQLRIYFFNSKTTDCENSDKSSKPHESVSFNGKLVRMLQYCDGGVRYFMTETTEGNDYVLKQFSKSKTVDLITYTDKIKFSFSTKNFNQYKSLLEGINQGI